MRWFSTKYFKRMSSGKCKTDDCIILIEYIWFKAFDSGGFGRQYEFKNIDLLIMLSGLEMLKPCS